MLQTIEVEIDSDGRIHPLEPPPYALSGRAYLTLLPSADAANSTGNGHGSAAQALAMLASDRYAHRQPADVGEVGQRIEALRNDWGDR
jgi:hypothetical protein